MMKIVFFGLLTALVSFTGCNDRAIKAGASVPWGDTAKYPRLYVNSKNEIFLNDRFVTMGELENKFIELKSQDNFFKYSSDSASEDPPTEGPVFELFKKYRVGIKMYTDSTFTKSYN